MMKNKGFSIIEALIGITITVVLLTAFTGLTIQAMKINRTNTRELQATMYLQELMEIVRDVERSDWTTLTNASCASSLLCHAENSLNAWQLVPGTESLDNNVYTRSLTVENVFRDQLSFPNNIVSSGGVLDPNTKKVIATIGWNDGIEPHNLVLETYVYKKTSLGEFGCEQQADVMLTLDRSGSISAASMAILKNAAYAFVEALAPAACGVHLGQVSFSDNGRLDQILTDVAADIHSAIQDDLGSAGSGYTNLAEGIGFTTAELTSVRNRDNSTSPNFMVIITDGEPRKLSETSHYTASRNAAKIAADNAKAAGITIYVIGVGLTTANANWLKNNIATAPADHYYFDAATWSQLENILEDLTACF